MSIDVPGVGLCQPDDQGHYTDACFSAMMRDISRYEPYLASHCYLNVTNIDTALSEPCRAFCRLDVNACRARRQFFCRQLGSHATGLAQELCTCYNPSQTYQGVIDEALHSGSVQKGNAAQLKNLEGILGSIVHQPYCWYQPCALSGYGKDTEVLGNCQNVGLCIQSIALPDGRYGPSIELRNNCVLESAGSPTAYAQASSPESRAQNPIVWILMVALVIMLVIFGIAVVTWYKIPSCHHQHPNTNSPSNRFP